MSFTHALSTNNYGTNKLIVSSNPALGTHTTLTLAMAAAVSGDTIFMRSSVTENVTLTPGVNIVSDLGSEQTPTISITGTLTMTAAGSCTISGIRLVTNAATFLTVSGSANSIVNLNNCYLNCTDNTGISYTSSGTSSAVNILNCSGNIGTTGITLFVATGAGSMSISFTGISNSGSSTTASTSSACMINALYCNFNIIFSFSSTGIANFHYTIIFVGTLNITAITTAGTGTTHLIENCEFSCGTASAVSVGAGTTVTMAGGITASGNANAITGAGTIALAPTAMPSSGVINTSTRTFGKMSPFQTTAIGIGADPGTTAGLTFDGTSYLTIFQQGTFSPVIVGSGTAGAPTMTTQVGRYQKVGRYVTISIAVTWTALNSATGNVLCNNLPYTCINNSAAASCPSAIMSGGSNFTTVAAAVPFMVPLANTATSIAYYYLGSTGAINNTVITATNGFQVQLVYETT